MKIVKLARGKETVIEEGNRKKMNNRLAQLRGSTRKGVSGRTGNKYNVRYELKD